MATELFPHRNHLKIFGLLPKTQFSYDFFFIEKKKPKHPCVGYRVHQKLTVLRSIEVRVFTFSEAKVKRSYELRTTYSA